MKLLVQKATTDVSVYLFVQNSSVTTGAGLTGLAYNSASLVAYYVRPLGNATAITLATQTVTGAHSDGGFVEVDATNMPGVYRLDLPDAVCATGVNSVVVMLNGATNMAPVLLEIQLSSFNPNDSVRLGLTALPNAAADAAGGLPISDAGGLDLDAQIGTKINDILTDTGTTLQGELDGIQADTEDIQTRLPAALVGGRIDATVDATGMESGAVDAIWDEVLGGNLTARGALLVAASGGLGAFNVNDAAATTTSFVTDLTSAVDDFYNDMQLQFTSGALAGQVRVVSDYVGATKTVTLDEALTSAPANGDDFVVSGPHTHTTTGIATAVWASAARTLTALDEDSTTLDIDAAVAAAVTAALTTALTEGYRGTGATGSVRDLLYEVIAHLGNSGIAGVTKTLKKLDTATTAKTYTLDDANTPTAIVEAS